jgi:uncharacterized DUF497 family protein
MARFDWDSGNADHILAHGVSTEEAEEAYRDPARRPAPAYNTPTEHRRALLGATEQGHILYLVFSLRGSGVRIITARDADVGERRRYRKGKTG